MALAERVAVFAALLGAATLLMCIFVRWSFDIRSKRDARFRRTAEPLLISFLAGRAAEPEVAALLRRDPAAALPLLMEISDRLDPRERPRLRPLFAALEIATEEKHSLRHRRWEIRLRAAERLGYIGDPAAVADLRTALGDKVLGVRLAAARALANLGNDQSLEPILLAFDLPGEMNQRRVAEILFSFGPAATDRLIGVVENKQARFSDSAVAVAARVLGLLRAPAAVAPLGALLASPEYRVRLNAARSLGLIGDRAARHHLDSIADDPSWEVRNAAVRALGRLRAVEDIPRLRQALGDQAWWVRFSAASALYDLGDPGIDALRETMNASADRYARDISRQILEEKRVSETRERKV